jgi:RHS repeat-associated protein
LNGVTQNAQSAGSQQTRIYAFDFLSRLTSETNPENGTTTYTFDSATGCTGTYSGDLVKKMNAVGNVTCLTYDLLHRNTSVTYPSGTDASVTRSKYFVYDSATVNGVAMTNAKGRLAEAYTCITCPGTKLTDIGYSYTGRGEVSDVYESTPHSSGYYHLTQTYWPHGAPKQLSGLPGLPAITYGGTIGSTVGLDGEGRITQVTAASGQNPVTAMSYALYSTPFQMTATYGSSDSDVFSFDANTSRMTQYKFTIGSTPQSVVGNLTWNANGALQKLVITDPFNSANAQTCNYSHDDLVRISSANCGSAASQTFSYDAFGNINKAGSPYTFNATYNSATNHISSVGSTTPTYDSNGNVTSDGQHTYSWDADGNSIVQDTVNLTFDALDRMVEQARGTSYTQIVYAPTGEKLALMAGSTLQIAFVPLPSGGTAVYTSSGLSYYRHPDWLGSSRFASTAARAMYSDTAYAPFGEPYVQAGTVDASFTGMNSDTATGSYDFPARQYATQGRWPSPDPAGLAAVQPSNPQSWNRYSYVLNNPLGLLDPSGLDCVYLSENNQTLAAVVPGDCLNGSDDGYFVDGKVTGIVANSDGQVTGVLLDGGNDAWSVGFDYNSVSTASGGDQMLGGELPTIGPRATTFRILPTIGPQTDWWNSKRSMCSGPAFGDFLGGLALKKEIDALGNMLMGESADVNVPRIATGAAAVTALHPVADKVAEDRPLIRSIRIALRDNGKRVTSARLARSAKLVSHGALAAHVAFAVNDGREAWNACMEN